MAVRQHDVSTEERANRRAQPVRRRELALDLKAADRAASTPPPASARSSVTRRWSSATRFGGLRDHSTSSGASAMSRKAVGENVSRRRRQKKIAKVAAQLVSRADRDPVKP